MDTLTAIGTVITVIKTLNEIAPIALQGIDDLTMFGSALYKQFTGGQELTEEDRQLLEAKIDALSEEFQSFKRPS